MFQAQPNDIITCGSWNQDKLLFVIWIFLLAEAAFIVVMLVWAARTVRLSTQWKRSVKPFGGGGTGERDSSPSEDQEASPSVIDGNVVYNATAKYKTFSVVSPSSSSSSSTSSMYNTSPPVSRRRPRTLKSSASLPQIAAGDGDGSGGGGNSSNHRYYHADEDPDVAYPAGKEPPSPTLVYPVYFKLLVLAVFVVILRAVVLRFVAPLISASLATVQFGAMNGLTAMVRDGIALFLVQQSAGPDAVTRAVCLSIFWGLLLGVTNAAIFASSHTEQYLNTPLALWMVHDMSVMCLHFLCLVLWFRPLNDRGRTARTWIFSLTLFLIYVLYTLSNVALIQNWVPFAGCLNLTAQTIYYVTWPPLAYLVLRMDSNYWRRLGISPIQDQAERKRIRGVGKAGTSRAIVDYLSPLLDGQTGGHTDSRSHHHLQQQQQQQQQRSGIIDFSHLALHECLGVGATAHVFRAELLGKREPVAVKRFHLRTLTRSIIESYLREVAISARLAHPNIVQLYGVSVNVPNLSMVMEFMKNGHLMGFLHKLRNKKRPAATPADAGTTQFMAHAVRLTMASDVCRAVAFLHSQDPPIIHLDIKSLNFLVDHALTLKLTDFGEARQVQRADGFVTDSERVGTPQWAAPEIFSLSSSSATYGTFSDVYSVGVVLWELLTGLPPYSGLGPYEVTERLANDQLELLPVPDDIPEPYARLMTSCWTRNPDQRPSAQHLLNELEQELKQIVN